MKRISAFLCSLLLFLGSVMSAVPVTANAAGTNMVPNPSVETSSSSLPTSWSKGGWGTNTATLSYLSTGHTGTHSLDTKITKYTNGDAKWFFAPVAAASNTAYTFSDWYKSTVASEVDIVVTSTSGVDSYIYAGAPAAATAWTQASYNFTTPANTAKVTVYHVIAAVGELTTDDYSLATDASTPAPTAPTVSVTAPAANATVTGTTTLTATATDAVAVSNVQFKVDGVNVGTADTTSPYSVSWDSTKATNGTHAITAVATNSSNLSTTSSTVNVTVSNAAAPTAPTVSVTAPAANATVTGTTTLAATAADAKAVSSVQFKVDNVNVGTADTTSPYSYSWNSTTVANGTHSITAVATNSSNLTTTSAAVSITVSNTVAPTPPTVSVTAPAANATVAGTTNLTANAADAKAVSSVQFKVDGNNVGTADTTSPYSVSWNSTSVTNGTHTVTAVATNSSNLATTSSSVSFKVSNVVTPPTTNLITNPSLETGTTTPTSWTADGWGTNTATNTYVTTGHTGSKSVKTTMTSYTNGDSKWMPAAVPVTANSTYKYSNWYMSNVDTEIDAMVTMSDGTVQYLYLTAAPASTTWTQVSTIFTAPVGASNVVVFQVLAKVGYVQTDDYSLAAYTPAKFNRPLVSLTFDDGWRSEATNGLPLLKKYGFVSTQYLNSEPVLGGYPDYDTAQMIKDFAAQGSELAWHTRTHTDLTTLSASAMDTELNIPSAFLTAIGQTASAFTDFATPYGAYNSTAITEIKKVYQSHRSTDVGYNSPDNLDVYNIKVQNVLDTTTPADVQGWVNQAVATNTWLVLVYHEVDTAPESPEYAVTPTNLDQELSSIKQSGVTVETVAQALKEVKPQIQQ